MAHLFDPLSLRGLTTRNRVWVSPMCQYSAVDGSPNDWHFVHLGKFALGGAGLILTEATAVEPIGRISPADTGLWNDRHVDEWRRIVDFAHRQDVPIGVQLAHAGRKASTSPPWEGEEPILPSAGGWTTVGPSASPFGSLPSPVELAVEQVRRIPRLFADAAARADAAGFDVVEIHGAHGYLLHQFLSPLSNARTDEYGGHFDNRVRLFVDTAQAVRNVWPSEKPLFVRISATDWVDGGWSIDDSVQLACRLRACGVDLVDCSSGGTVPDAEIPVGPGYQVAFAERVRTEAGIPTAAVGRITSAVQADAVVSEGRADAVLLGKELLRRPTWPLLAASELGVDVDWPVQYETAKPRR